MERKDNGQIAGHSFVHFPSALNRRSPKQPRDHPFPHHTVRFVRVYRPRPGKRDNTNSEQLPRYVIIIIIVIIITITVTVTIVLLLFIFLTLRRGWSRFGSFHLGRTPRHRNRCLTILLLWLLLLLLLYFRIVISVGLAFVSE